jgi:hypothetical protein
MRILFWLSVLAAVTYLGLRHRKRHAASPIASIATVRPSPERAARRTKPGRPDRGEPMPSGRMPIGLELDDFWFDIVGEQSYSATLDELGRDELEAEGKVVLDFLVVPEPTNRYDPNAIRVAVEGQGTVGYFSREDAVEFAKLRELLIAQGAAGMCRGTLTGGWDADINIGVRLAIQPSETWDASRALVVAPAPPSGPHGKAPGCKVVGWETMTRIPLGRGKKPVNLVGEGWYQSALQMIDQGRLALGETVVFEAFIVPDPHNDATPDGKTIVVCAENLGPVGRFANSTAGSYEALATDLRDRGAVGVCDAWLILERGQLGVKVTLPTPKEATAALAPRAAARGVKSQGGPDASRGS